jgi:hypothetical protein
LSPAIVAALTVPGPIMKGIATAPATCPGLKRSAINRVCYRSERFGPYDSKRSLPGTPRAPSGTVRSPSTLPGRRRLERTLPQFFVVLSATFLLVDSSRPWGREPWHFERQVLSDRLTLR